MPKKTVKKRAKRKIKKKLELMQVASGLGTVGVWKGDDGYLYIEFRLEDDKLFEK